MRSSFAKSIYVGAAVLGLAGLSAVTTTTASAKSYATAGSYTALTKGQNVLVNGTNAIYSKPGTVKGAKVVASKKTVAKLAASKKSNDTFYAYGTKTTNRGSVYYKIVTMDKKYRGYIYGGKTAGTFAGGIKTTDTLTTAAMPTQLNGYYIKNVSKNTVWSAPKNTDINAHKISLQNTTSDGQWTITSAATKTKEGSLYYKVVSKQDSSVSGWIYSGGISTDANAPVATNDNSVLVNFVDGTNNVSSTKFVTNDATKAGESIVGHTTAGKLDFTDFVKSNVPSGYVLSGSNSGWSSLKFGQTVNVTITKAATSKASFYAKDSNNLLTQLSSSDFSKGYPALTAKQQEVFSGAENTNIPSSVYAGLKNSFSTYYSNAISVNGNTAYYKYTYNPTATYTLNGNNTQYGSTVKLVFDRTVVTSVPSTSTDSGNTNYVG
ncbi:S-layer protein [Levilactobacillus brevis]|uniref:S-layer protein n=1 Tax=Levilactobacillus brevis TaxID=1580 RepID=UPI000DCB3C17|nr:S-layer protein [Levilactobacillus brevis]RAY08382.1 S-layer protein [Levilactobacillus brevis]